METAIHTALSKWESFYVIVGSSGGALTGLQFVVITLLADSPMRRRSGGTGGIDAFGTPTIVHFCTVLLMSGVLSAPWRTFTSVAVVLGAIGLAGLAYCAIVYRRTRAQKAYTPVLEDWLFHVIFPCLSYIALCGGGLALYGQHDVALFPVAAASLGLLFIGIHNAWDTVVFIAMQGADEQDGGRSTD